MDKWKEDYRRYVLDRSEVRSEDCLALPPPRNRIIVIVEDATGERPEVMWFGADTEQGKRTRAILTFTRVPPNARNNTLQPIRRLVAILMRLFPLRGEIRKIEPLAHVLKRWSRKPGPKAGEFIGQFQPRDFFRNTIRHAVGRYHVPDKLQNSTEVLVLTAECLATTEGPLAELKHNHPEKEPIAVSFPLDETNANSLAKIRAEFGLEPADMEACAEALAKGRRIRKVKKTPRKGPEWLDSVTVVNGRREHIDLERYRRVSELFVEPAEHGRMLELLQNRGILFIVGPPHFGKTFAAVSLLQHYCDEGRAPRWFFPRSLQPEPEPGRLWPSTVHEPSGSISGLVETIVNKETVTFIEDPLGHITEEEVSWTRFGPVEMLNQVFQRSRDAEIDSRVIVTSRDVLFDRVFGRSSELEQVVVRIGRSRENAGYGSYGPARITEILERYSGQCAWHRAGLSDEVRHWVLDRLETPQSVQLFCELSESADTVCLCQEAIEEAARDLLNAFTRELADIDEPALAIAILTWFSSARYCVSTDDPDPLRKMTRLCYPDMTQDDLSRASMAAQDAFAGRIYWESASAVRIAYDTYKRAIGRAMAAPHARPLLTKLASALAGTREWGTQKLAGEMVAHMAAAQILDEEGRALADRLLSHDDEVACQLCDGLGQRWNRLSEGWRERLMALAEGRDRSMLTYLGCGLADHMPSLDAGGRKLLWSLLRNGTEYVRQGIAMPLSYQVNEMDNEGHEMIAELAKREDEVAMVLSVLLGCLTYVYEDAGWLHEAVRPVLRRLSSHKDDGIRNDAVGLLGKMCGEERSSHAGNAGSHN